MVKFEIWDTGITIFFDCHRFFAISSIQFFPPAGQERFNSLAPMYYRGAQAALVVYDITNEVHVSGPFVAQRLLPLTIFPCNSIRVHSTELSRG